MSMVIRFPPWLYNESSLIMLYSILSYVGEGSRWCLLVVVRSRLITKRTPLESVACIVISAFCAEAC